MVDGSARVEGIQTSEVTKTQPDVSIALVKKNAPFADATKGNTVKIDYLDPHEKSETETTVLQQEHAKSTADLANKLKNAKGEPFFGDGNATEDQILELYESLPAVFEGSVTIDALYLQQSGVQSENEKPLNALTASFMTTILSTGQQDEKLESVAKRALDFANQVSRSYEDVAKGATPLGFDLALVGKDGSVFVATTENSQAYVWKANGEEVELVKGMNTLEGDDKLQPGDTIVFKENAPVRISAAPADAQPPGDAAQREQAAAEISEQLLGNNVAETSEPEVATHAFPYYEDVDFNHGIKPEDFLKRYPEAVVKARTLLEQVQQVLPRSRGESEYHYQRRINAELQKRIRYTGDYKGQADTVHALVDPVARGRGHEVLMALEALDVDAIKQENERRAGAVEASMSEAHRRDVKTRVRHVGVPSFVEGDYEHYFDVQETASGEKGLPAEKQLANKELPQADLYAFAVVADHLLDVIDPEVQTGQETQTYRQLMQSLEQTVVAGSRRNGQEPSAENKVKAAEAAKRLTSLRSHFYARTIEAMRMLGHNTYINQDPATQNAKDKTLQQMQQKLEQMQDTPVSELVEGYKGVRVGFPDRKKVQVTAVLDQREAGLLDLALKGADLMQRRISYAAQLEEVPDKIYYKDFVQGGDGRPQKPAGKEPGGRQSEPVTPGPQKPDGETPPPIIPAPERPGQQEDGEQPEPFTPGPEQPGEEDQPPIIEPPPLEPQPLKTQAILGAGADDRRVVQNSNELVEHVMAQDLQQLPVPGWANTRIGRFFWTFRHPVTFLWQTNLARNAREKQLTRFAAEAMNIVKRGTADASIPVEVTPEVIDRALTEGRANTPGGIQGFGWRLWDAFSTLSNIGQTSEQIYANRWLREEMAQPRDQRDGVLRDTDTRALSETTKLGDRFAAWGERRTLEESNRVRLREGETRYQVPENMRPQVNDRIKALIEQYANNQLDDRQLIAAVNQYLREDFRNGLPADLRPELDAAELATNILTIAHDVTGKDENGNPVEPNRWQRYQTERTEDGKTAWEAYQIKLLFGRAEFGARGGRSEMGVTTEWLARRLARREAMRGEGTLATAIGFAQDAITYGGSYLAGWGGMAATGATGTLARSFGGSVGISYMAALKETGFDLSRFGIAGLKGRYQKEIEQLSREAARGRVNPNGAQIRPEMEAALVNRIRAEQFQQDIEPLIANDNLTADQARELLVRLASLDARLRLTDLSGTRAMRFRVQNFIEYIQGQENKQMDQLRGLLENGLGKLALYYDANPGQLGGNQLFTGERFRYGQAQGALGEFERYSALAEAQLRVSSGQEQVRQWLQRELRVSDATTMMQRMFPQSNLNVQQAESLEGRNQQIDSLRGRRGLTTFTRTLVTSLVGGLVVGVAVNEGADFVQDTVDSGRVGKYFEDWGRVLRGNIPLERGADGHPVADTTPLQQGVLLAEHFLSPDRGAISPIMVDGVTLRLPSGLRYDQQFDAIVDTRNGRVAVDMTEFRLNAPAPGRLDILATADLNGDGGVDAGDDRIAADLYQQRMQNAGITVEQGPTDTREQVREILRPGSKHLDTTVGYKTNIPDGTEWVKDPQTGRWDLIVSSNKAVLIDNAQFDQSGKVVSYDRMAQELKLSHVQEPGGGYKSGKEAVVEWEKIGQKIHHREWYANNTPRSDLNELRLYTHKDGDAVVLDMSKMGVGKQMGLNPGTINVQDVIKNHEAGFAISIPGLSEKPVWISDGADGVWDGKVRLDPNDTTHKITINGMTMTMGEFTKRFVDGEKLNALRDGDIATELHNRLNVFKIGADGKNGFIEAGRLMDRNGESVLQTFATIRGVGAVGVEGNPQNVASIDLTDAIRERTQVRVPTFTFSQPPIALPDVPIIPIPPRFNIEKSILPGTEQQDGTVPPPPGPAPIIPPIPVPGGQPPQPSGPQPGRNPESGNPAEQQRQRESLARQKQALEAQLAQAQDQAEKARIQQELDRVNNEIVAITPIVHLETLEEKKKKKGRLQLQIHTASEADKPHLLQEMHDLDAAIATLEHEKRRKPGKEVSAYFADKRIEQYPPVTTNPRFVQDPPEHINISVSELVKLRMREPFFINHNGQVASNPTYIPWDEFKQSGDRFSEAERKITHGDSGLFALTAALASTSEAQAQLYRAISEAVLQFHKENPHYLKEWLTLQNNPLSKIQTPDGEKTPYEVFERFDLNMVSIPRREEERLLPRGKSVQENIADAPAFWQPRVDELVKQLQVGKLEQHHLRWVEFLSHSVDVQKLLELAKAQQPQNIPQPTQSQPTPGGTTQTGGTQPTSTETVESTASFDREAYKGNVAESLVTLREFAQRSSYESKETYEASVMRALEALGAGEGIVTIRTDIPTIIIPDLHARRDFLLNVMEKEVDGVKVYDLLKQGKINVVCVGDGMHSEDLFNWQVRKYDDDKNLTEYGKLADEMHKACKQLYESDPANTGKPYSSGHNEDAMRLKILGLPESSPYHQLFKKYREVYQREWIIMMDREMNQSLGLMKMVMDLKSTFPAGFHYLRGNHDEINGGFSKFADESEMVRYWLKGRFGEEFIDRWATFEDTLPILLKGKAPGAPNTIVVTHAAPFQALTEEDAMKKNPQAVGIERVLAEDGRMHHRGITWTDNTQPDQMIYIKQSVPITLTHLGLPSETTWFIGHRQVDPKQNYRSQLEGRLIQVNNPEAHIITIVPADTKFDPDTDIIRLN